MDPAGLVPSPVAQTWQLDSIGPDAYDRYLVPAFFARCAELVSDAAGIVPGCRVLDVACGTGIVARTVAARVGGQGSIVGVDLNDGMLAVARSVTEDVVPAIRWIAADVNALPFEDASFDIVTCQQGVQFFPDTGAALGEVRRVLAPTGRAVVAMWRQVEQNSIFGPFIEALDGLAGAAAADVMRGPFAGPPIDQLRSMLADAGFGQVAVTIELIHVRFPSVEAFIRREVMSSPLRGPVGGLDPEVRAAFVRGVEGRLEPWVDDLGLSFPMETWIVTASSARPAT